MIPQGTPFNTLTRVRLSEKAKAALPEDIWQKIEGKLGVISSHKRESNYLMWRCGADILCLCIDDLVLEPTDPETELLNRLAAEFPQDMYKLTQETWVNTSHVYADHPDTVCAERDPKKGGFHSPGQGALGFLNQCRKARGLPVLVCHRDDVGNPNVRWHIWFAPSETPVAEVV